jgi:hypothetical protein
MKIALSETFLEDFSSLQHHLQKKCRDIISSVKEIDYRTIRENSVSGWRIHKLQSSPFISFSLDMNFRMLAKIEGETIYFHRAVKHSLADSPRINKNDNEPTPINIDNPTLKPDDIYHALISIGISPDIVKPFIKVSTEEDFLNAVVSVDEEIAQYALTLYETSGVVIPRTKYTLLQTDSEFEETLFQSQREWEIYLHPSQQYIVKLPSDYRTAISGSAGTGKTVCAWYRLLNLSKEKTTVGFVAPNKSILKVSEDKLGYLTKDISTETYFLVPSSDKQLIQLAQSVQHLIIDEGQELTFSWYKTLSEFLKTSNIGVTIFYDLNQLGANYELGDTKRFEYRIENFIPSLKSIPKIQFFDFYINYRNSKEISTYYLNILKENLPNPIKSEIPVFSGGAVLTHFVKEQAELPVLIADTIKKLKNDFSNNEIGIICLSGKIESIISGLSKFGIPITSEILTNDKILVTNPQIFRGHEKKVVIICAHKIDNDKGKIGKVINAYIGYSRARDRLIIFEY